MWLACGMLVGSAAPAQTRSGPRAGRTEPPSLTRNTLKGRLGVELAESLLKDRDPEQRQRGFERLASVGTAQALDLLLAAFESGGAARSAEDRLLAVRALSPHAAVPAVREFLVRVMVGVGSNSGRSDAIDELIEHAAALALAAAGDDAALSALGKALRQPGHVAEVAKEALLAHPPRRLTPILEGLRTPSKTFVSLLGSLQDPRAIPALRKIVQSAPSEVRAEAAVALARLGELETLELARHWLEPDSRSELQVAAARILLEFRAPDSGLAIARLLGNEQNREAGLELASRGSFPVLEKPLLALTSAASPAERSAWFNALALSGTPAALSYLGGALAKPESSSAAALALANAPARDAEVVLERALAAGGDLRRAALRAGLVRWVRCDRKPSGMAAALDAIARSTNRSDRAIFAQVSALLNPENVPNLLRDASDVELRAVARAAQSPLVSTALAERLALEKDPARREVLAAGLVYLPAAERVPSDVLLALIEARGVAAPLAARALSARDSRNLRPKILALLKSDDALLRSHAALGLGQSEQGSALGVLERAYRFERDEQVRLAIVQALAARPEGARRRVLGMAQLLDRSAAVREAAAVARASSQQFGHQSAWLELARSSDPTLASQGALGAILVSAEGLALPVFADDDGVLLVPGLPTGPFELRLAAPPRSDNAHP